MPHDAPAAAASADLLFEIGTEEIPAGFLARALSQLDSLVPAALAEARLTHGRVVVWGTPRRLAVAVAELASRQPDLDERVVGPPVKAAFDAAGKPTRAAHGFADKNRVTVESLERAEVPGQEGRVPDRDPPGAGQARRRGPARAAHPPAGPDSLAQVDALGRRRGRLRPPGSLDRRARSAATWCRSSSPGSPPGARAAATGSWPRGPSR